MNVRDLRELLEGVDDDMEVLIPTSTEFDGMFKHPCIVESGVNELGETEHSEPFQSFILVPCGFFEIDHEAIDPQLN